MPDVSERYRQTLPAGALGATAVPVQVGSASRAPTFAKLTVALVRSDGAGPGSCTTCVMSLVIAVVAVGPETAGAGFSVTVTVAVTLLPIPKAPVTVTPDGIVRLAKLR